MDAPDTADTFESFLRSRMRNRRQYSAIDALVNDTGDVLVRFMPDDRISQESIPSAWVLVRGDQVAVLPEEGDRIGGARKALEARP